MSTNLSIWCQLVSMCSIELHEIIKDIHINGALVASINRCKSFQPATESFANKLRFKVIECLDTLVFNTEEISSRCVLQRIPFIKTYSLYSFQISECNGNSSYIKFIQQEIVMQTLGRLRVDMTTLSFHFITNFDAICYRF